MIEELVVMEVVTNLDASIIKTKSIKPNKCKLTLGSCIHMKNNKKVKKIKLQETN